MSTINLLRELKCLKIDIPTIVLGSQHDFPEVVKVMRAGATDFLGKPFTDHRLKSSIKRALS
ncbi:MAG: response regulator [Candidatus Dadabacteria bacterium]|nr:response regulator [Candidatus Dadabacteria bacterium]